MAGGVGARFWPWSRAARPKQLLPLTGPRSMLVETVERLRSVIPDEQVLVVTSQALAEAVAAELPRLPRANVLAEPVGRNTAPCIGWATREVLARDPDGVCAVVAADHRISPVSAFRRDLRAALGVADRDRALVTFGIVPTHAATGYGYIEAGAALGAAAAARRVARFVEKPPLADARRYLRSGRYFWNSGMFAWRADVIDAEIRRCLPDLAGGLDELDRSRRRGAVAGRTLARIYPRLAGVSIDYGVLEHTDRAVVVPSGFQWNDIGSWEAIGELWARDRHGNASRGPLVAVDARDNIVASERMVAVLGMKDVVVVDSGDAVLVCPRQRCQDVRQVVDALAKAGRGDLL
jgi:mannose-1-phosphate guanylyltransferase